MNETKVIRLLGRVARIIDIAASQVRSITKDMQTKEGVFLVRGDMGYDVQVDGIPLGMELSWSDADKIVDLIKEGRKKAGWAPSGPGPAKKL